ncbi:hypothetical protein EG68_07148 [Paragonimus skrjabini miyazakii]|uniref:Uncharacterized protein n=1 Tax=Paragonimus skrjabini miyazakii TaxID=59628 RepID=A0A8S9YA99_9TREM|nr:hypothetical protein EG68_07148 [Paragonimus skrjabini miyazakii]
MNNESFQNQIHEAGRNSNSCETIISSLDCGGDRHRSNRYHGVKTAHASNTCVKAKRVYNLTSTAGITETLKPVQLHKSLCALRALEVESETRIPSKLCEPVVEKNSTDPSKLKNLTEKLGEEKHFVNNRKHTCKSSACSHRHPSVYLPPAVPLPYPTDEVACELGSTKNQSSNFSTVSPQLKQSTVWSPKQESGNEVNTTNTSNSNSFGVVITTNLDSKCSLPYSCNVPQQFLLPTPYVHIQQLGGLHSRYYNKQANTFGKLPHKQSGSLDSVSPDTQSPPQQARRYVTELKLNLCKGRAHRVTQNWNSMANDRDSPLGGRNDIADNDVAPVKAILCRAAPCDKAQEEELPEIGSSEQKPVDRFPQYDATYCPSVTRQTYVPCPSMSEQLSHPDFRINTDASATIQSSTLQQNSHPANEVKYPFSATVGARTISRQLHQLCHKREPGITYLAEQLERKKTPHLYMMEQKQPSPSFISGTPTDSHQGRNLSLDTTIPPLTATSPRWPLLNPANMELNELVKDVSLHNFQTVLNGAQRELGYDDTSGMSACTCMRSSMVEEPSVRTFRDCLSSATVISPLAGKTSRGTQSEQMQIQTGPFDDQEVQTTMSQKSNEVISQKVPEFNVNKTVPVIRGLHNLTPRSQAPSPNGLNSKPPTDRDVRYHVCRIPRDELQSCESASLVTGSPSTFLVLAQANVNDQLPSNSRQTEEEATVGAGDHILVGSSKISQSSLSAANRYWDETSCSKTIYHVVRENVEASRQQIKLDELKACEAGGEEHDQLKNKSVTAHGTMKITANQDEDGKGDRIDRGYMAANSIIKTELQVKAASPTLHPSRIPTLTAYSYRTLKPSQESVIRDHATFSILPNEDIVLVEGGSTPVSWRKFSFESCDENYFGKQSVPTTIIKTTGDLNQVLLNQPLNNQEHISEKCAETTHPMSCCKSGECECSMSESSSESRTYQCDCCQPSMNVTSEALKCADHVFDKSLWQQQKRVKQKYDGAEGSSITIQNKYCPKDHVCDIVYDPSFTVSAKQSTRCCQHSEGEVDESTGRCSTCSGSSSCETSCSRSVSREPSHTAYEAGQTTCTKSKNHMEVIYDKRSPPGYSTTEANAVKSLSKSRGANNFISAKQSPQLALSPLNQPTQPDSGMTPSAVTADHMRLREESAWKQQPVSKPVIKETQRRMEEVQMKDLSTGDKHRLTEPTQDRLSAGKISEEQEWVETKKRLQQRLKGSPHLDTLFNLVGEKEKRNILQRWLLEQVAYSTKKNPVHPGPNSAIASQQYGEVKTYEENSDTECSCSKCKNSHSVDSGEEVFSDNQTEDSQTNSSVLAGESSCLGRCNPHQTKMLVDTTRTKDRLTTISVGAKYGYSQQSPVASGTTCYQWDKHLTTTGQQGPNRNRPLRSTSEGPRYVFNGTRKESPECTKIHKRTSRSVGRARLADRIIPGEVEKLSDLKEKTLMLSPTAEDDYRPTPNGYTTAYDRPVRKGVVNNGGETLRLVNRTSPKEPFQYDTGRPQAGPIPGMVSKTIFSSRNMRPAWSNRTQKPSPAMPHTGTPGKPEERTLSNLRNPQATSRLMSNMGFALNLGTPYEVQRVFEVSQYDDLVKSHLNTADRRIKAVGLKNGCDIKIIGPITSSEHPGNRSKISYQCQISAPTEDRIWKCINFLKETFPNSFLRSSWRA